MASLSRRKHRLSITSDSSSASSPERELDDDCDFFVDHHNDSQSSLGVSLEDMELDSVDFERQRRLSPICRLPAELLINVFAKLNSTSDLQTCMLVCKAWARNSVDLLWYRPSTSNWKNLINVIKTASKRNGYFAYHDLIKRLNLGQLKHEVSDGTLIPLSLCKRIERLTLPGCSKLTDLSISQMIRGNRSLMAVDVSDVEMISDSTMHTLAENCFRLQGLNVSSCKGLTDESLVAVARNCRRIKRLKLNDCAQLTDYSVMAFADNCHDILEIDLHKCLYVTDMAVTALITQCRQLRELRLAQCSRITDEAFGHLPQHDHFDALRILDLTDCNELTDCGLQKITMAAPRLRNLVLAKCRNIGDRGLQAITRLGKNLHYLHLGHCTSITDTGVSNLIKYCNRIRYIDFSCCINLTDESVSLLATLPKLKRIGLVKCNAITDRSIRALARPKPPGHHPYYPNNLERLHLSYCTNLSIRGVRTMLLHCPQLTHLSLTGVPPFLQDDLLHFCRPAPAEFNDHQRDVFCVFSGPGVTDLRNYLYDNYRTPPESDVEIEDEEISLDGSAPNQPAGNQQHAIANAQAAHGNNAPIFFNHSAQQQHVWRPTLQQGPIHQPNAQHATSAQQAHAITGPPPPPPPQLEGTLGAHLRNNAAAHGLQWHSPQHAFSMIPNQLVHSMQVPHGVTRPPWRHQGTGSRSTTEHPHQSPLAPPPPSPPSPPVDAPAEIPTALPGGGVTTQAVIEDSEDDSEMIDSER